MLIVGHVTPPTHQQDANQQQKLQSSSAQYNLSFVGYYRPQRSWGKVIFSVACVKNSVHCMLGYSPSLGADTSPPPTPEQTPLGTRHPTPPQTRHPPWEQTPPLPAQYMLGDTGNKRAVRILLECNLVHILRSFCLFHKESSFR